MTRRPIPVVLFLSAFLVLVGTTVVVAKDDVIVTFDAALPTDPEPGSELTVGWTVETPGVSAALEPFNAEAVFIRLIPATGEPIEVVGRQDPPGHYVATVTVPDGGIRDVEIGVRGESCSGGTCQRSDVLFTIDDVATGAADPAAAVYNPVVNAPEVPGGAMTPVGGGNGLQPVPIIGLVLAAGAIVLGVLSMRARSRALTPGSSRS